MAAEDAARVIVREIRPFHGVFARYARGGGVRLG
jgi:hypothetical protein